MKEKTISVTIEILGKIYPVRCLEAEVNALQEAATHLNQQMEVVKESGKVINLERIAIITALNMTYQFLQLDQQKKRFVHKINQKISNLQDKLEEAGSHRFQTELAYLADE